MSFEGPGLYKGEFNPGAQFLAAADPALSAAEQTKRVELYCAALGDLLHQEAVAYHQPFYDPDIANNNGGEFAFGRTIEKAEMQRLYAALRRRLGSRADSVVLIPSRVGLRVLNLGSLANPKFHDLVFAVFSQVMPENLRFGYGMFAAKAVLIDNDWRKAPHGEGYKARYLAPGTPRLSRAVDRVRTRIEAINQRYAQAYGW